MSPELSNEIEPEAAAAASPWWKSPAVAIRSLTAWAAAHRMVVLGGTVALVLLAGVPIIIRLALVRRPAQAKRVTLPEVFAALDNHAYNTAEAMAQRLQSQIGTTPQDQAGALYVQGDVAAHDAEAGWHGEPTKQYLVAAGYLKEARDGGFPKGREAYATYLYGKSLYRAGKIADCRKPLREALRLSPAHAAEIRYLLASTSLLDADQKPGEALEENSRALLQPELSLELKTQLVFQRAEALIALGRHAQCEETLRTLPPHVQQGAEAMLLRGQALIAEARKFKEDAAKAENRKQALEKYQQAIQDLRLAQGNDTLVGPVTRKAMYLVGVCFLESGDLQAAGNQFDRTFTLFASTPEAVAAAFQKAELARQLGHHDQALSGYRQAAEALADPESYVNPWLRLDEIRTRSISAYQYYLEAQKYEVCLELAHVLRPLFPPERTIELTAETYRAWGRALIEQADRATLSKADTIRREGRAQMRRAADAYRRLAQVLITHRRYSDELWNAVQAYLDGHDYRNAATTLKEYLRNETHRRHAEALVSLGECMLSLEQYDEAVKVFNDCIVFHPLDATAFRARLLASRAYTEKGDLPHAETLLRENLQGEMLTPESTEWRESLFDLGRLLYTARRYDEAIARLEEAVARYPDSPRALESQYLIADSFRRSALAIEGSLSQILVENTRTSRAKQIREAQAMALARFEKIQDALGQRQELGELTALEKAVLRNSQFAVGGLLYDLGRYEESIRTYATAANRARNTPVALEAYTQIASAYRRLDKPLEARLAIEQAQAMLNHVKNDVAFTQNTNYNRKQWADPVNRPIACGCNWCSA